MPVYVKGCSTHDTLSANQMDLYGQNSYPLTIEQSSTLEPS